MSNAASYVDAQSLPWRATPHPGVSWKKLRFDVASGESAVLLRFDPGASYAAHRHPGGEQYLVLEGSLEESGQTYGPMSYVHFPPGTSHRPSSRAGCVVFVVLPRPIEEL